MVALRVFFYFILLFATFKGFSQHILINEFYRPSALDNGWIEIGNPSDSTLLLHGSKLTFHYQNEDSATLIIGNLSIEANNFEVVQIPSFYYNNFDSVLYVSLRCLNPLEKDSISLETGLLNDESIGRYPNFSTNLIYYHTNQVSAGQSNVTPGPWLKRANKTEFGPRDSSPNACLVFNDSVWVLSGWRNQNNHWFSKSDVYKSGDGIHWKTVSLNPPYNPYSGFVSFRDQMWAFHLTSFSSSDGIQWDTVACNIQFEQGTKFTVFKDAIWAVKAYDIWKSDDGINWEIVTSVPWISRSLPGFIVCQDKLWFFGGGSGYGTYGMDYYFNDVWYSEDGINWQLATNNADWPGRYWFTAQSYNDMLFLIGGWNFYHLDNGTFGNLNDIWFSEDGISWKEWQGSSWENRHAQLSFVFENSLWFSSGYGTNGVSTLYNDVWQFDGRLYFSKRDGEITNLETWNTRMDGEGIAPDSFETSNSNFFLINRDETKLSNALSLSANSRLIITNREKLIIEAPLDATVDLEENSVVEFSEESPQNFQFQHSTSTVVYDLDNPELTIRPKLFPNLTLKHTADLTFEKDTLTINGNLLFEDVSWQKDSNPIYLQVRKDVVMDSLSDLSHSNFSIYLNGDEQQRMINNTGKPVRLNFLNIENKSDTTLIISGDWNIDSLSLQEGKMQLLESILTFNRLKAGEKDSYFLTDEHSYLKSLVDGEKLFPLGTQNTFNPIYLNPENLNPLEVDTVKIQLVPIASETDTLNVGWKIENFESKEITIRTGWSELNEPQGFSNTYLGIIEVDDTDTLYCISTSKGGQEAKRIIHNDGFYTVINSNACRKSTQTVSIADKLTLTYGDSLTVPITSSANIPIHYDFKPDSLATVSTGTLLTKGAGNSILTVHADSNESFLEFTKSVPITISKKVLNIVAKDTLLTYGLALNNVQFEIQYNGFTENDSVNNLKVAPELQLPTGYLVPGTYSLDFTSGYDDNYIIVTQNGTLTIEEPTDNNFFNFSPNPAKDKINIVFDPSSLPAKVFITSYLGQLVYEKTCTQFHEVLYLPKLSDGLYLIQIGNGNNPISTRRLLIVN